MRQQKIDFQQCKNAFLRGSHPEQLQELADSLTAGDILQCGLKWLAAFTPFFTERERREALCQHRLFFAQAEYCDNLIFFRRAAVDELEQRLLDMNRTIGQPKKITIIFGRKVTREYKGKLQTVIEDLDLPNPVIRSHYAHGFAKQYVRDNRLLRTEPATNDVRDYGVNKDVANLPKLRQRMAEIIDNYHNAQQDILETFIDRGQLRKLAEPTILANGKRIPGLKLDHPRQLALMPWCASPILPRARAFVPRTSTPSSGRLWARSRRNTRPHPFAMIFPNCAPRVWSRRSLTPAVTAWLARAIRSASSFSNCSNGSMPRSLPGYSSLFLATANLQNR